MDQSRKWWTVRDSNPGPTGYEPAALPTELTVRFSVKSIAATISWRQYRLLAPPVGFEPTTLRLTAACSTCWAKEAKGKGFDLRQTLCVGIDLSSRSVSRQVLSALVSLTSVFGMGTGGPSPLKTPTAFGTYQILHYLIPFVKGFLEDECSSSRIWYTFRDSNPGHPD